MNSVKRVLRILAAAGFVVGLVACDNGPFEKAGKSIDRAGEKAGDTIKDAAK